MSFDLVEVCPNCGDFVERLHHASGWCYACSPPTCKLCGEEFDDYGQHRDFCSKCRKIVWDQEHADAIERYLADGLTLTKARQAVKQDGRPACLCCGEPIPYGNPWRDRFCSKQLCKRAARRYRYYRKDKRMSQEEALALVIESLTREKVA